MANTSLTYEGIGIYVDRCCFFMNFELGVLFFDKKTTILSPTYERIGMIVDDWKINPVSFLGGHGNRKIVQYGLLGSHKMDGVN
jgi:hypothetical protein